MKSFLISSSSLFFISLVSTIPSSTGLVTFQAERKALIFHTKSQNRFAHCHTTKLHGLKGTADESRIASNAATKNIALSADEGGRPGTATLDVPWEELGFEFRPTKSHLSMTYKDGMWGPMELHQVSMNQLSMFMVVKRLLSFSLNLTIFPFKKLLFFLASNIICRSLI
jgi:hypothetical protein